MYAYDIVSDITHDIDDDLGEGGEQRLTGSQRRYP